MIDTPTIPLIDVNVHLFAWPFRRLPDDDPMRLERRLAQQGVQQVWAGSFEAVLHRDVDGVNRRLAAMCRRLGPAWRPFGVVHPLLPDWEEDLRRCAVRYRMPGIRLYPNYHQYGLEGAPFSRLLEGARRRGMIVQIAVSLEDERTQHPLVRVPPVDVAPLCDVPADATPPIVLLNACRVVPAAVRNRLVRNPRIHFDLATLEGAAGLERWLRTMPVQQTLFGSHAPFFYHESATAKLNESVIGGALRKQIVYDNAARLMARRGERVHLDPTRPGTERPSGGK